MLNKNFQKWFNTQKKLNKIKIKIKKLNDLENWNYGKKSIFHISRRFLNKISKIKFCWKIGINQLLYKMNKAY